MMIIREWIGDRDEREWAINLDFQESGGYGILMFFGGRKDNVSDWSSQSTF